MPHRILIVDDEPTIRYLLKLNLGRRGYDVEEVSGGAEAQACLEQRDFQVALIDLRMPGVDGFELLEWMKDRTPRVVPIVLSGTTIIEDAIRAMQCGAFDFVTKPVEEYEVLIQQIERAIRHRDLAISNARLLQELRDKNIELENRLGQLEMAHSMLQSQAVAIQVDLNRAMRIQQSLLPRKPPFPDRISLSAMYRPAGKVGGDLYDIFQLDDHHFGIYVADTSGHGITSALLTVFLKHSISPFGEEKGERYIRTPGQVLAALNEQLISEDYGHDIFISIAYAVINGRTREGVFASAGHPSLLVRRCETQEVTRLHVPAPALGINPKVVFSEQQFKLDPKDILLLHTDGLTEARNSDGYFYGTERLYEVLRTSPCHADDLVRVIEKDLLEFCGQKRLADDITVVALAAEPERKPFDVGKASLGKAPEKPKVGASVEIATASEDGRTFISISGSGSWRESQQVFDLCEQARRAGENAIVLDLNECAHLDSTFLGVLHNITTAFDEDGACRFELQRVPTAILREMSELGLTAVLMHFRPTPISLPEKLARIEAQNMEREKMGRLVLWAHESLVSADPRNADRFAAVLKVLEEEVRGDGS